MDARAVQILTSFHGENRAVDAAAVFIASYSSLFFAAAFFAAVLFILFYRKKERLELIVSAACILPAVIIINYLIRRFVSRPRPFEAFEGVLPLVSHTAGNSFPSNHAAASFAVACFIYMVRPSVGIVFMILSVLVSFARVYAGLHYPLDVLGGMALAGFISAAVGINKKALARAAGGFFRTAAKDPAAD